MSSPTSKTRMECLRIIEDMCCEIIFQARSYLNDGSIGRMKVIENEILNIEDQIEKIRTVHAGE